jgi:hypothetical protein
MSVGEESMPRSLKQKATEKKRGCEGSNRGCCGRGHGSERACDARRAWEPASFCKTQNDWSLNVLLVEIETILLVSIPTILLKKFRLWPEII